MKLTGKTTTAIRKAVGYRSVEIAVRYGGEMNELLMPVEAEIQEYHADADLQDLRPLHAGLEIADSVGLIRIDLWLRDKYGLDNATVWVFDDGIAQHVYTNEESVPGELMRAVIMSNNKQHLP